jgi:hypothetical protein
MKAYIITTKFTWPDNKKVAFLTNRCEQSCIKNGLEPVLFKAITPYNLEEHYFNLPTSEEHADRLMSNFIRKTKGSKMTPDIMRRMLVVQQCMTMSHYKCREQIIETKEPAVILEHDAIVLKPINHNWPYNEYVVNLCSTMQHTHGYVLGPKPAKRYNELYHKLGYFMSHDNMNRAFNEYGTLKVMDGKGTVAGNQHDESQWDTHRGAIKENLDYIPTTTVFGINLEKYKS